MVLEIVVGRLSGSVALTAEGIHMGAHVVILGMSWAAYVLVRRRKGLDGERILATTAAVSAALLLLLAVGIDTEAAEKLYRLAFGHSDERIDLSTLNLSMSTLYVAIVGLIVNIVSARVLHGGHDLNRRAAYLHVVSDALTSLATIVSLCCAWLWGIGWLDGAVALASAVVIAVWAVRLLRKSLSELASVKKQ